MKLKQCLYKAYYQYIHPFRTINENAIEQPATLEGNNRSLSAGNIEGGVSFVRRRSGLHWQTQKLRNSANCNVIVHKLWLHSAECVCGI